ncbi:MAG: amino acid permease [Methyloligellaceae bacterium]
MARIAPDASLEKRASLKRSVSLPLLTLYGLGTTVGAGIYVLIGATAAQAGYYAPLAFVIAALVVAIPAACYAELSSRFPVSAGEAAYVRAGFGDGVLPLVTGLLVAISGIVSSATLVQGGTGYLRTLLDLPEPVYLVILPLLFGAIAVWGVSESLRAAALFTIIEVGGLLLIIIGGNDTAAQRFADPGFSLPPFDGAALAGVFSAGLIAFFAFIGFEDIVNLAEEVRNPKRTIPWAIGLTLAITTLLYVMVCSIAVLAVPLDELTRSSAPLSLVLERAADIHGSLISVIAVAAVLNGVLIQMIMASRVFYGLARMGKLPALLGRVHPVTRTPVNATLLVTAVIMGLAFSLELEQLATMTSVLLLMVFALVNLALWRLKRREPAPPDMFSVPDWLPLAGFFACVLFLLSDIAGRLAT